MIVTDPENVEKNMNWILSVHSHHFTFPTIFIPLEIDFVLWSKKKDKISEESLDNNLYKKHTTVVFFWSSKILAARLNGKSQLESNSINERISWVFADSYYVKY